MILAAGYLLWMFQRVAFGELSDFLKGLGGHLTDMRPDRGDDARAARRAGRHLRPVPGPDPRPRRRLRERRRSRAVEQAAPVALGLWR